MSQHRHPQSGRAALTASGYQRRDKNGVTIGPWSDSVKRTIAVQRKARAARYGHPFTVPFPRV